MDKLLIDNRYIESFNNLDKVSKVIVSMTVLPVFIPVELVKYIIDNKDLKLSFMGVGLELSKKN